MSHTAVNGPGWVRLHVDTTSYESPICPSVYSRIKRERKILYDDPVIWRFRFGVVWSVFDGQVLARLGSLIWHLFEDE